MDAALEEMPLCGLPSRSERMDIGSEGGREVGRETREVGRGCGSGVGYCAWRERLRISKKKNHLLQEIQCLQEFILRTVGEEFRLKGGGLGIEDA
jgi:hypothetical protein